MIIIPCFTIIYIHYCMRKRSGALHSESEEEFLLVHPPNLVSRTLSWKNRLLLRWNRPLSAQQTAQATLQAKNSQVREEKLLFWLLVCFWGHWEAGGTPLALNKNNTQINKPSSGVQPTFKYKINPSLKLSYQRLSRTWPTSKPTNGPPHPVNSR